MRVLFCVFWMLQTIVLLLLLALYFLLKYILPPVLFTLTQVVLLLITSTFARVQIQSNLGTTDTAIVFWWISVIIACHMKLYAILENIIIRY
jgi:hypothetical protein